MSGQIYKDDQVSFCPWGKVLLNYPLEDVKCIKTSKMYDVLVKRSNPIRHSITVLQLKQYVWGFFYDYLIRNKVSTSSYSFLSLSLKTDMGWWTLKANSPQRCTCLRQLLLTDEKCNVPDPKGVLKATGGNKGFILSQVKPKETKAEIVWAGLDNDDFKMASMCFKKQMPQA